MNSYASDSIIRRYLSQGVSVVFKGRLFVDFIHKEALAKVLNNNVAANFSLRVLFYFNTLQTQAKACGYQNRSFARASKDIKI